MNLSCGEIVNIVAYIRSLDRWRELKSACDVPGDCNGKWLPRVITRNSSWAAIGFPGRRIL